MLFVCSLPRLWKSVKTLKFAIRCGEIPVLCNSKQLLISIQHFDFSINSNARASSLTIQELNGYKQILKPIIFYRERLCVHECMYCLCVGVHVHTEE